MSSSSSDRTFEVEQLSQIVTRCKKLREENDMLRESQSQSLELIKQLELHVKSLSEVRTQDMNHIQKLERELLNSSQEIDYFQDQLNLRNSEVYSLGEHVHDLELKLAEMDNLQMKVGQLTEELNRFNAECFLLTQELESKDIELQKSVLHREKLEESISSLTLDTQCEIESMKLDIMALEQECCEARKKQNETTLEKARMDKLIEALTIQVCDAEEIIKSLKQENFELKEKLATSEENGGLFLRKVEEWLRNNEKSEVNTQECTEVNTLLYSNELESKNLSKEMRVVLGILFSELTMVLAPVLNLKRQIERMSDEISKYEILVKQLKDELREEKLKAKEEAEDLAQEMAELRYQMTGLLEEECKRRACIEQVSLQRIAELEAQIPKDQRKLFDAVRHLHEA